MIFYFNFEQLFFELTSCSPNFLLTTSDFNVTTFQWRKDSTNSEGTQIEALAISYGLNLLISSPTQIL